MCLSRRLHWWSGTAQQGHLFQLCILQFLGIAVVTSLQIVAVIGAREVATRMKIRSGGDNQDSDKKMDSGEGNATVETMDYDSDYM